VVSELIISGGFLLGKNHGHLPSAAEAFFPEPADGPAAA
jgi:hypothetical protein